MFRVVIVSWNVQSYLRKCLTSLSSERAGSVPFEVVVVDNNSADGSADSVKQSFPWVKLISLNTNVGFAKACNLGAENSSSDYILFLNPDTEVATGFFSDLERSFIQHPDAAVVGGHIYNDNGSTQLSVRAFPTCWIGFLEAFKLLNRFPKLAKEYLLPSFDYSVSQAVDQVMGACFAVRSKIWLELDGFDDNFFVWFEEVDFCKRCKLAGYNIWYESRLSMLHSLGRSFSQLSYTKKHKYYMQSMFRYLKKHSCIICATSVWLVGRIYFICSYTVDYVKGNKK